MSSVVRSGWRFNGNGAYGSRGCAVSHSQAKRWCRPTTRSSAPSPAFRLVNRLTLRRVRAMSLVEYSKHPKPVVHERRCLFGVDQPDTSKKPRKQSDKPRSAPIIDELISQALYAYPLYVLEDVQNVVPEQVTDLFVVGSPKQVLLRGTADAHRSLCRASQPRRPSCEREPPGAGRTGGGSTLVSEKRARPAPWSKSARCCATTRASSAVTHHDRSNSA